MPVSYRLVEYELQVSFAEWTFAMFGAGRRRHPRHFSG